MPISLPPKLDEIAPGIPFADDAIIVPLGIEVPLDYNGVRFNNRGYREHIRVVSIDGLDDADIRAVVENNPGDDGESVFDSPLYGGRTLVLNCRIEADTLRSMRGMKRAALAAFNDLQEHPLVFVTGDPETTHQIVCRKTSIAGTETQGNNPRFTREFQVTLRASDPRFVSFIEHVQTINLASATQMTVVNRGDYRAKVRVRIAGYAPDPSFKNMTTDQYMHVNGPINNGDTWTFDMKRLGTRLTDINGDSKYDSLLDDAERITLAPGANVIQMDAAASTFGANAKLSVYWNDSWL